MLVGTEDPTDSRCVRARPRALVERSRHRPSTLDYGGSAKRRSHRLVTRVCQERRTSRTIAGDPVLRPTCFCPPFSKMHRFSSLLWTLLPLASCFSPSGPTTSASDTGNETTSETSTSGGTTDVFDTTTTSSAMDESTGSGTASDDESTSCSDACATECEPGETLRNGECVLEDSDDVAPCPEGEHECDGECVSDASISSCGSTCTPCPAPANGSATCEDGLCGFSCNDDSRACDGSCIAEDACCTDSDCAPGLGCRRGTCVDNVAPQVASISPEHGAAGVTPDARIEITFSESMDPDSIRDALSLTSAAEEAVTTVWNDARTVLTLTVDGGLSYATGPRTTAPLSYTLTVGDSVRDVAGNWLGEAVTSTFTTFREISEVLPPSNVADVTTYRPEGIALCEGNDTISVGWWIALASGGRRYGFLSFNLANVAPYSQVLELRSAVLVGTQFESDPDFFVDGSVRLERVEYGPFQGALVSSPVQEDLGTFAASAASDVELDVTEALRRVWDDEPRQMFRLSYAGEPPGSTYAVFMCNAFGLALTYRTP